MLETERVLLTAIEPEDAPMIARWRNTPGVYTGFIEYEPLSAAAQAAFIASLKPGGNLSPLAHQRSRSACGG